VAGLRFHVVTWSPLATAGEAVRTWFSDHGSVIGILLVAALVAGWVARIIVKRVRRGLGEEAGASEHNLRRRVTLISSLAYVILSVFWAAVLLAILAELGVDLAPFIASAGVVGVALGFGAQALVRDFLAGFYVIAEDQYGLDDFVQLNLAGAPSVRGRVHTVTLRSTQVREGDGTLTTTGNGFIVSSQNLSRGPGQILIEVAVPPGRELERVEGEVTAALADIQHDERVRDLGVSSLILLGTGTAPDGSVTALVSAQAPPSRREEVQRVVRSALARALR
jgi:moderate conductance mechanosensitive channel